MNWPRVKTILIFLFLVVDLILLATIIVPTVSLSRIPQETIENTAALLNAQGIEISPDIIPARRESMGIVEIYNLHPQPDKLAKKLLGTAATGENNVFSADSRTLTLTESGFKLESSAATDSIAHQLIDIGIDVRENLYEQGKSSLRAWQAIDGKKIFESEIYASQTEDKMTVSGYWIFSDSDKKIITNTPDTLMDVTGVLIDFISNPLRENNIKITSVELGFSTGRAYRDTSHKLVSASPAYKISTASGAYYMYDALSGEFLYFCKDGKIKY